MTSDHGDLDGIQTDKRDLQAMTADLAETVNRLVDKHKDDRGALLPILHDLQHETGHIPPAAVPLLARALNLSRAEVHGVVTFYRDFRDAPAAATVRICRGEACQAVGAEVLAAHARQKGYLEHVFCLGNCALGPSVEVNGTTYGRVDAERLDGLLSRAAAR
jgi:formate dehydrogenase subunit gamma